MSDTTPKKPKSRAGLIAISIAGVVLVLILVVAFTGIRRDNRKDSKGKNEANAALIDIIKADSELNQTDFEEDLLSDSQLGIDSSSNSSSSRSSVVTQPALPRSSNPSPDNSAADKADQTNIEIDALLRSLDSNSDFGDTTLSDTNLGI